MSVQSELTRLESAKEAIKAAIEGKGVTVPDGTLLDGMAALIEGIPAGGGADGIIDRSITSIASNATEVGQYAFYGCGQLETASFPEATTIHAAAFIGCESLVSISCPKVTEIRNDAIDLLAFNDMEGAYASNIVGAFDGCVNLKTINFPLVETIGACSFSNCTGLAYLKFPKVKTIGETYTTNGGNYGGGGSVLE